MSMLTVSAHTQRQVIDRKSHAMPGSHSVQEGGQPPVGPVEVAAPPRSDRAAE